MKFTFSWIKDHIDIDVSPSDVSKILTDLGLEVESYQLINPSLKDMLVCEVKKIKKHPNADRLTVCEIFSASNTFQVVCGANNLYENMKTIFAPNGTYIPGKKFTLEKKNIRGIEGDGMLCSEQELCMSDESAGIIDLDKTFKVGDSFSRYIKEDYLFEVGLTPNRGDCASVRGIARELAAKLSKNLKSKEVINSAAKYKSKIKWDLTDLLDKKDCPLIMGREFNIEKNPTSPFYIKQRLMEIGVTPNSALVDITNYILFDLGRPLHVFDMEKISGNLRVRRAKLHESFSGLDKKNYILSEKDLVIADDEKVVSLAGVMGSSNSCVDENTKKVFLEVAYFDPNLISETGRRHNILTDARYRFERGIDKNGLREGLEVATEMIMNFCKGSFSSENIAGKNIDPNLTINYETPAFRNITGYDLKSEIQADYLKRLGFKIKGENTNLLVTAPSWRNDIVHKNDIVEEILRLDGYDRIPFANIVNDFTPSKNFIPSSFDIEIDIKEKLANLGLNEIKSFTFISQKKIIPVSDFKEQLKIVNPISKELSVMRNSLYPNLLDAVSKNFSKGNDSFSFFETGDIFNGTDYSNQKKHVGIVMSGYYEQKNWHSKRRYFDFFDIKKIIFQIIKEIFPKLVFSIIRSKNEYYHPGKSADIIFKGEKLGSFGELHPKLRKTFQIKQQTVLGNLFIDLFLKNYDEERETKIFKLSPFLTLKKDFSFMLPEKAKVEDLIDIIKNSNKNIGKVLVFDVYKIEGKKFATSVGVEVEIIQEDKVLNSIEINEIMNNIISLVKKRINAELRSQ